MELYIVRHGDAIDPDAPGVVSDAARTLTAKGRDEIELAALALARLRVRPGLVLSSPLVRAMQTADILARELQSEPVVHVSDELAPGGSLAGVLNDILSHGRPEVTVIAGHNPGVGMLVGYLVWRQPDTIVPFRTGQVCRVDLPESAPMPGSGDLRWMLPPGVARRLTGGA